MRQVHTIVQFTTHEREGSTAHRMTWPMQALGRTLPEFRVVDVHYLSPCRYQLALEADLLVLSMHQDADLVPILRWRKAKGRPTVYEVNDYIFDVVPWTPIFELWRNPAILTDGLQMIRIADLVQTTSPVLAKVFAPYNPRIAVFPNQLWDVPARVPEKPHRPMVVGWGGSLSHIVDMAVVSPAVSRWVTEHDDVVLAIMGNKGMDSLFHVPPERKRFVTVGDMDAYGEFLKGVHIGLAPLCDTVFNRGRSDVKWLEYAAQGCVFVGRRIPPYAQSVRDGETGFLYSDAGELIRILDKLYQDRSLVERVRRAAFEHVAKNRLHSHHVHERARVYRELLERESRETRGGESWDLDRHVRLPHPKLPDPLPDYFQITLDSEDERALAELHYAEFNVRESSIREVEERYGEFHLTAFCRGLLALGRRDLSSAEQHSRRALSFYPASVRSLALLGRALLAQRQFQEARETLSSAVQWNRGYMPAYRYLVSAAEKESEWEAGIAAAEEWGRHFNDDPCARIRKGLMLIQAGRRQGGMEEVLTAMNHVAERWGFWQLPFAAELIRALRKADRFMGGDSRWKELIVKAAEMFPYGMWLAVRAGAVCFQRGDYGRGARILQDARERLTEWEWQEQEQGGPPPQYRGLIDIYRTACEELADENRGQESREKRDP